MNVYWLLAIIHDGIVLDLCRGRILHKVNPVRCIGLNCIFVDKCVRTILELDSLTSAFNGSIHNFYKIGIYNQNCNVWGISINDSGIDQDMICKDMNCIFLVIIQNAVKNGTSCSSVFQDYALLTVKLDSIVYYLGEHSVRRNTIFGIIFYDIVLDCIVVWNFSIIGNLDAILTVIINRVLYNLVRWRRDQDNSWISIRFNWIVVECNKRNFRKLDCSSICSVPIILDCVIIYECSITI